jgi:hypothetical protein
MEWLVKGGAGFLAAIPWPAFRSDQPAQQQMQDDNDVRLHGRLLLSLPDLAVLAGQVQ